MTAPAAVLTLVEAHLLTAFGQDSGRASVAFVGTDRIDVLRFGPDPQGLVRYVTLGLAANPMSAGDVADPDGPRAELLLTVRGLHDSVLRRLAVLAASPAVEGLVIRPGARLGLGEPLWDGAAVDSVLVGRPGEAVASLEDPAVDILPLLPMTPNEAAWCRVHGGEALEQRWLARGTDLRDPHRAAVDLQ